MTCVNVSGSTSISVMELIMTRVLPELSVAPAVNDDPPQLPGGGVAGWGGGGGRMGVGVLLLAKFSHNPPGTD